MFAKTVCKPGAYLCVVPIGLRTTLQYNAKGVLEKILRGYGDEAVNISDQLFDVVKSNRLVPLSIPTKGGTTWISGVFYTAKEFFDEGILPECIETSIIADISRNPNEYEFYAGNVDSLAASFKAILTARNWLSMSKFKTLPGYIIPANLTQKAFEKLVNTDRFPFKFPLISGYMIWEGSEHRYHPINLTQFTVSKVVKSLDENGYIQGALFDKSGDRRLVLQYSDVISMNIQAASNVVCTDNSKVIYTICTDGKKRDNRSSKLTCSICGKTFISPRSGPVTCNDAHCMSRQYPNVCHFLKVLNLPEISYDKYIKYVKNGDILFLPDIMLLPEYEDSTATLSLSKLLRAATPVDVCPDSTIFTVVASRCGNSIKTLKYYINNPNRLKIDLNIDSISVNRWISWLSDSHNVRIIETLIDDCDNIIIDNVNKKFEGAPIFRDKKIALTGRFRHGDMEEVMSILRSYSAEVVTDVDDSVGCLIIGGLKENIEGRCVQYARSSNIPIFDEDEFFKRYEIDDDLAKNLL